MAISYIFIVGISLILLFTALIYALRNLNIAGSKGYFLQIILVTIWSVGSLFEMVSPSMQGMLFWRNFQQIGIFLLPVACVYFAVDYARYDKLKKYIPFLLIVPLVAIALIFTDEKTHVMRIGYTVSYSTVFGKALSVQQTNIGKLLVSYNYLLALISLVILFVFSRQVSKNLRRQVILALCAIGLVFLLGFLKSAFIEGTRVNIPIVTIYLPSSIILSFNLYKNNFFRVTPIAREKVFDVVEMGIIVTDSAGMITDINPYAIQILKAYFGISDPLTGKKMCDVLDKFTNWVNLAQTSSSGEEEIQIMENGPYFIHIRVYPLQSHRGASIGSVSIMRDVTVLRMQEATLKMKAETDSLTGLLNRESFMEVLTRRLRESKLSGQHVSVLMMDLDKFKSINDTYGHGNGDIILKAFADVLKEVLRHEDAIARIGGDEFEAVLPGVGRKDAAEIANRILNAANRKIIQLGSDVQIQMKLSIGICDNEIASSAEEILKLADQAMYRSKNQDGNCYVFCE